MGGGGRGEVSHSNVACCGDLETKIKLICASCNLRKLAL